MVSNINIWYQILIYGITLCMIFKSKENFPFKIKIIRVNIESKVKENFLLKKIHYHRLK